MLTPCVGLCTDVIFADVLSSPHDSDDRSYGRSLVPTSAGPERELKIEIVAMGYLNDGSSSIEAASILGIGGAESASETSLGSVDTKLRA